MSNQFAASQSVEIVVPEQPIPIQHYLRQPQRLVYALFDPSRIEQLDNDIFRLRMRPLTFLTLSIQPTADLKVWAEPNGTIHVQSVACEILGFEYINQRFVLNLKGHLSPYQRHGETYLTGKADLKVEVELPAPLFLTPKPIVEAAGNGLLKSVLMTIKQRLLHQLLTDYRHWVNAQSDQSVPMPTSVLPSNNPAT